MRGGSSCWQVMETEGVTLHSKGITSEVDAGNAGPNFSTLARAMHDARVTWVDILKIDAEGVEWDVFEDLLYRQGLLGQGAITAVPFSQVRCFTVSSFVLHTTQQKLLGTTHDQGLRLMSMHLKQRSKKWKLPIAAEFLIKVHT